jgi:AraC-like DNA-binding protein
MIFRPTKQPAVAIPMGARSVGRCWFGPRDDSGSKIVDYVQVLWGVRGSGMVTMSSGEERLGSSQVALYFPGNNHRYHGVNGLWELVWWTMDGPLAASVATSLRLVPERIYRVGPAPLKLFRDLELAIRDVSPGGEYRASLLAYQLLTHVARGRTGAVTPSAVASALDLIHREWNKPSFGVKTMAHHLGLHRSSLSRKFHSATGVSPIKYLTMLRIQNALGRLKSGTESITEIAYACGWSDISYFSRCIQRATGYSPRDFRRQ